MNASPAGRPLTSSCSRAFAARDHACLGISPFNSRFGTDRIEWLARWALAEFDRVHFFVPDGPAAYTLEARGYLPERAAKKARLEGNHLRNKIRTALARLGVDDPSPYLLDSAALASSPEYSLLLGEVRRTFEQEAEFQSACLDAARDVVGEVPELAGAVRYLLEEMPVFTDTPQIVGSSASVFVYHQGTPFLERLYGRELHWRPAPGQGYVVI